eukprot:935938_1
MEVNIYNHANVKTLYSEYGHWFKLLSVATSLYGDNLSRHDDDDDGSDGAVYVHFEEKIHCDRFHIHCNVPFIAAKDRNQLPQHRGMVLELAGAEPRSAWSAPFFSIDSLGAFTGEWCLFFKAKLQIESIWFDGKRYNMAPLCLCESILNGDIISNSDMNRRCEKQSVSATQSYPNIYKMLQKCENRYGVSAGSIIDVYELLEARNTKNREEHVWRPSQTDLTRFVTCEQDCIVSDRMKAREGSRFLLEMAVCEHRTKYGTISLIMNRLPRDTNEAIISCQFYCQAMHGFCVKFDHIVIKMDGNENNMKQTAYFKWECLEYGFEQVDFEWVIVIIHKAIKQVNAQKGNPKDDRNITEEIMTKHASEAEPIREILANDIPLHRFDSTHVCNVIRWWCMTDILFKSNLEKVMNLFSECSLSGVRIMSLSMKNIKRILKKDLLELMTPSTFGILLRKVKYWKTIQDENIIKQRAEEVGYLLCRYPADRLMERVCNKNDPISGIKVIQYYRRKNGWIKRITGWDDAQIYQIHAVLFKHGASLSKRIRQRAFAIFAQRFEYSIASKLRKCIRVYSDIDLETINYEFKNGHTDLQSNFTDTIMDFVSKHSKQSDGLRIYKAVVDCFIPNYTEMTENLSEYALDLDESWTCCNCSNYNFSNFVDGKINTDLS